MPMTQRTFVLVGVCFLLVSDDFAASFGVPLEQQPGVASCAGSFGLCEQQHPPVLHCWMLPHPQTCCPQVDVR